MDRRKFLEISAFSSAGALFLNGQKVNAFSQMDITTMIPPEIIDGRSLVMVQLRGGNDGLNTLIPVSQYDEYRNLRPTISLNNTGSNSLLSLDDTLADKDKLYIHPSFTGLKSLYEEGKLNIIHNVGYPSINKSHFASRALMFQGSDGETMSKPTGWMARFLESGYDPNEYEDPLGIQLGSRRPSLGFQSNSRIKVDINLSQQDVEGYFNIVDSLGNPNPNVPLDTEYGEALDYISTIENGVSTYSERISKVFTEGREKREVESTVTYPDNNLADQLRTVATLIRGGSRTKIFLVSHDGFDTHANQVEGGNPHLGKHAELLQEVGDALKAFQDDLGQLGVEEQVVSATFTEFGRKPGENGNFGTDHGNLGPMFVIGATVNPGITGNNIDLSEVQSNGNYDQNKREYDYRQVFTTIASDFLGATNETLGDSAAPQLNTEFGAFLNNKIDLINNKEVLAVPSISPQEEGIDEEITTAITGGKFSVYPNPVKTSLTLSIFNNSLFRGKIILYNFSGAIVFEIPQDFSPRLNLIPVNISHLQSGNYILAVTNEKGDVLHTKKINKI